MKRFFVLFLVCWVIFCVVISFTGSDDLTFLEIALFAALYSGLVSGAIAFAPIIGLFDFSGFPKDNAQNTKLISCKNCGFIGVGSKTCPKCGRNRTEKIASDTKMISCRECGYFGAGVGFCPRCGRISVDKIN